MKISTIYFTREALSSFRQNFVQSIAAVTTVALCLVIIGLILMLLFIGSQIIQDIEQKVEIEIFLDAGETSDIPGGTQVNSANRWNETQQLGDTVRNWKEVSKVEYVSKEQALREFKQDFKNSPDVTGQLEGNPLPASYRVRLKDPRKVEQVVKRIKELPYTKNLVGDTDKNIQYGRDTVKKLFAVTRWISIAAGSFAALLIFVSLVLITNTIRLAIFARRKEIGIMRLVGASSWFIRWPFLLEGMLEGVIGAVIAILVLTGLWRTVFANLASGKVVAFLAFPIDQGAFIRLIMLLAVSGAAIGALGSFIALRRFLKV